jgi:hypothetical protein
LPDDQAFIRVRELLSMEIEMYAVLRKMTKMEMEAIMLRGDMDALLSILREKGGVISRLQLLADAWQDAVAKPDGAEAGFSRSRLPDMFSEPHASEVRRLIAEADTAASELMAAEDEVKAELQKYSDGIREKILSVKRGRTAVVGYARMGGYVNARDF